MKETKYSFTLVSKCGERMEDVEESGTSLVAALNTLMELVNSAYPTMGWEVIEAKKK